VPTRNDPPRLVKSGRFGAVFLWACVPPSRWGSARCGRRVASALTGTLGELAQRYWTSPRQPARSGRVISRLGAGLERGNLFGPVGHR